MTAGLCIIVTGITQGGQYLVEGGTKVWKLLLLNGSCWPLESKIPFMGSDSIVVEEIF